MEKATGKAKQATAREATRKNGLTITFGTLTFPLNPEPTLSHLQVAHPEMQKEKQPQPPNTEGLVPVHTKATNLVRHNNGNKKNKIKRLQPDPCVPVAPPPAGTKFHKVPPATEKWQKVLPKPKFNAINQKRCFFCHQKGHLQRFCLKKIKCYSCGRYGHKWAKCLFKPMKNSQIHTAKRSQIVPPEKTNLSLPSRPMEFIHGGPPIGDIYCPPRLALNDENEHLSTVGLIVLIRGSPTPDLPRLIATTIAAEHGGRPGDYVVRQASITPYVLSCPNAQTRDAVVQRGLYSIPRTQCQFTVNQWRPRFGMGFDPPSYQAWIQITGLPLQAWTVPEITAIVQRFGHPLHIQPFGAAAGHYRHISVLVATVHPVRIPLAYMYREGDYSTQVDVLILSWRQWEDNYFPPPDDLLGQGDPLAHPQHHLQHTVSANNSSSSSSNSAPSEPTIDYSSWSPRSFGLTVKWTPKTKNTQERLAGACSENTRTLTLLPHSTSLPAAIGLSLANQQSPPKTPSLLATEDPNHLRDSQWNAWISATLLSLPTHIELNLPSSLPATMLEHSTFCAAQNGRPSPSSHKPPLPRPMTSMTLALATAFKTPIQMTHRAVLYLFTVTLSRLGGPFWPNPADSPHSAPNLTQARLELELPLHYSSPTPPSSIRDINSEPQARAESSDPLQISGQYHSHDAYDPPQLSNPAHLQTAQLDSSSDTTVQGTKTDTGVTQSDSTLTPGNPTFLPSLGTSTAIQRNKTRKGKMVPTRRSQRLQARKKVSDTPPKRSSFSGKQTKGIPFNLGAPDTPLSMDTTLQILQATGLEISKQVQDMVQQAAQKDQHKDRGDGPSQLPTTPLHDLIPPLEVPGFDLPL